MNFTLLSLYGFIFLDFLSATNPCPMSTVLLMPSIINININSQPVITVNQTTVCNRLVDYLYSMMIGEQFLL